MLEIRLNSGHQERDEAANNNEDVLFEFVGERFLVQENPRVLELPVEPVLDPPDTPNCVVKVAVPGQHHHRSVGFPNIQGLA